jgi:hypothetical protein
MNTILLFLTTWTFLAFSVAPLIGRAFKAHSNAGGQLCPR